MDKLLQGIQWFVADSKALDSLSISYGTAQKTAFLYENADVESIYDLASLTKLFTLIAVMQLVEQKRLRLDDTVTCHDPRFIHLGHLSIHDLLAYQENIVTPARIDEADSSEAAYTLLFQSRAMPYSGSRFYSDMHAMILKHMVEEASDMAFFDYLKTHILIPLDMQNTFAAIPPHQKACTQSYDMEHRIVNGQYLLRKSVLGVPHDPKAALISPKGDDLCGHAGLFSTLADMAKLCRGLLCGALLSPLSLSLIAQNRTGRPLPSGGHTQYLGYLCFVKHPNQYFSEVPAYMSNKAFAFSGFTGNHLSIDPVMGLYNVFLGNRCLNRLTILQPDLPETLETHGLTPDGQGLCRWTDGRNIYSSVRYVHQKDNRLHTPIHQIFLREGLIEADKK